MMTDEERAEFERGVAAGKAGGLAAKKIRTARGLEQHLERWHFFDWVSGQPLKGMTARWNAYKAGYVEGYRP